MAKLKGTTVTLRGTEEIIRRLEKLPSEVSEKVMASALRAGAKIIAEEMKRLAPRQKTKDAIGISKTRKSLALEDIEYRVGPDNSDFVALYDEFGTGERFHRSGHRTGRHPVRPFARPAFERSKGAAEARVIEVVDRGIAAAVRRLNPSGE